MRVLTDGILGMWIRADKLLHTMVMLKLGMVRKKVLLFVNSINAGYRLKLFLEAFGIRSAVINAELPLNSRHHILQVADSDTSTKICMICMQKTATSHLKDLDKRWLHKGLQVD